MSRVLMLLAIAAAVYWLIRSYRRQDDAPQQDVVEDMVRCAHCGVHLPRSESIQTAGRFYCCIEHRDASIR